MLRSKRAVFNIFFSLILQMLTIASGFIIPILIIENFGSSVNGLTVSITQFLGYLTLLQSGVGGVVKASLYKPLAMNEIELISATLKATENFFRKIAFITIVYVLILAVSFPLFISIEFDFLYTSLLVVMVGIGTFAQYYFGITYQLLLQADQKEYIYSIIQMFSVLVNTIVVIVMVSQGAGIHLVKLGGSLIFLVTPLVLSIYVRKKYNINRRCKPNYKSIEQRWDGVGHTIAYFAHYKTDIVFLALLLNLHAVSVYSVYILVTNGLNILISSISRPIQAAFGNMNARGEYDTLNKNFRVYECLIHILTVTLFTSAIVLILPFISIYTKNILDANYIEPLFAIILIASEGIYCLRQPYHSIIISAGHFRQTRNGAYLEALIKIIASILLLKYIGLPGVVLGTLLAMIYRTIDYVLYLRKRILFIKLKDVLKRLAVSGINIIFILLITYRIIWIEMDSYPVWGSYAIGVTVISIVITIIINRLFYKEEIGVIFNLVKRIISIKSMRQDKMNS